MPDDYIRRSSTGGTRSSVSRTGTGRPASHSGYASADGVRRTASGTRTSSTRTASSRPSGTRPSGTRSSSARPSSVRSSGTRPSASRSSGARRYDDRAPQRRSSARRKRRTIQPRFFLIIAIAVILLIVLILLLSGGKKDNTVTPQATPTAAPVTGASNVEVVGAEDASGDSDLAGDTSFDSGTEDVAAIATAAADQSGLSDQLDDSDTEVAALAAEDRVQVSASDLSVNTSLPEEWLNVVLLGTDERIPNDAARTDAIIICSINKTTGQVKLTSIARDTAIDITGTNGYDGTYRINAINFFGGPNYVMKFLNEKLNMNIQNYVSVNFFGFQKIATMMGGIDVDISEAEMNEINKKQIGQAKIGYAAGLDESDLENVLLETYGPNTHLNGRQTLAYARCRYVDNDMGRMERQRTVLVKLMEKLRGKSTTELLALAGTMINYVTTNMDLNSILEVAMTVLSSGTTNVDSLRLPINGSYTEERRNDKAMLYDTDWSVNANELYNFIYVE